VRNSIKYLALQWLAHYDDGSTVYDTTVTAFGLDDDSLRQQIAYWNAQVLLIFPGNEQYWTFSYPNPQYTAYFLFDKNTFFDLIRQFPDFFYNNNVIQSDPSLQFMRVQTDSPRAKGWTDNLGVKRRPPPSDEGPPPDFSGAAGLVEALQGLLTLASDLTAMREVRKAGIVLYAYNQVIKQIWSITQAIQYLIDNRITATVG
jgi:hypothetical protein